MTADYIMDCLRVHFPRRRYALLPEVANSTGFSPMLGGDRFIDAVALCCWPSRGLKLHAIEIKISRSDYRREVRQPDKAESIARYADHFWIAAPPALLRPGELPERWGLLEPLAGSRAMRVAKRAPQNENPDPLDRGFVASILRRLMGIGPIKWKLDAHRDGKSPQVCGATVSLENREGEFMSARDGRDGR